MEAFAQAIKAALLSACSGCQIEVKGANNGFDQDKMLSITDPNSRITKAIPLDSFFMEYTSGRDLAEICFILDEAYREICRHENSLLESMQDFKLAEDSICYRLANLEKVRSHPAPIPYVPFIDMAVMFFVSVAEDDWLTTIAVSDTMMRGWGISDTDRLCAAAHRNTCRLFPSRLEPMSDLLNSLLPEQDMTDVLPFPVFVLSNNHRMYGSSVMLYDGAIKSSADMFGDDLIIIPSSIHELFLIPASNCSSVESMKEAVLYTNRTVLDADDVLSDSIYYYSRKREAFRIL